MTPSFTKFGFLLRVAVLGGAITVASCGPTGPTSTATQQPSQASEASVAADPNVQNAAEPNVQNAAEPPQPTGHLLTGGHGHLSPLTHADLRENGPSEFVICYYYSPKRGWAVCLLVNMQMEGASWSVAFADLKAGVWSHHSVGNEEASNDSGLAKVNALLSSTYDWQALGEPAFDHDFNVKPTFPNVDLGKDYKISLRDKTLAIVAGTELRGTMTAVADQPISGPRSISIWNPSGGFAVAVYTEYSPGYESRHSNMALLSLTTTAASPTKPCTGAQAKENTLCKPAIKTYQ